MNKVLYFGNFDCKNNFASINRAINISRLFSKLGYETLIYAKNSDYLSQSKNDLKTENIQICEKPFSGYKNYLNYKFYLEKIKNNKDVKFVVLYNFPSYPMSKIIKFCRENLIKTIADTTEWYDTKSISFPLKLFKYFDVKKRMKKFNLRCDGQIVISNYLLKYYEGITQRPLIKIYPTFLAGENVKTERLIKENSQITLGYIGNDYKGKDEVKEVLDFVSSNERFKLICIGDLNQKIKNKYACKNIVFYDRLNHEDVLKKYLEIDFSVTLRKPTRKNNAGFPSKVAESIINDTPVIFNDFSDLKELNEKNNFGICVESISDLNYKQMIETLKTTSKTLINSKKIFSTDYYFENFKNFIESIK